MKAKQLWFTKPYTIDICEQELDALKPGEVLVRTLCSAISAGTEQLVYRGQLPVDISLDTSLETLKGESTTYPLQYGYASVGIIEQAGSKEDEILQGKLIFAYQPHSSHFNIPTDQLIFLPDNIETDAAVFLANMETAVNLVLDGNPKLGESVIVIGQGIVGLLLTGILNEFPLTRLYTLDTIEKRRNMSELLGVNNAYDPTSQKDMNELNQSLGIDKPNCGADLVYEVSGSPESVNLAIDLCGYDSRIIIGSWYGTKSADIRLGGNFHRNRIKITSSQVSTIAPELSGRWDKDRRFTTTWEMIRTLKPERLISHRIPFESAADAYQLLDKSSSEVLQTLLVYQD